LLSKQQKKKDFFFHCFNVNEWIFSVAAWKIKINDTQVITIKCVFWNTFSIINIRRNGYEMVLFFVFLKIKSAKNIEILLSIINLRGRGKQSPLLQWSNIENEKNSKTDFWNKSVGKNTLVRLNTCFIAHSESFGKKLKNIEKLQKLKWQLKSRWRQT
jgi:hypothetical protein